MLMRHLGLYIHLLNNRIKWFVFSATWARSGWIDPSIQ